MTTTVWSISIFVQSIGSILIALRALQTPTITSPSEESWSCRIKTWPWIIIESGSWYTSIMILVVIFILRNTAGAVILMLIMGQLAVRLRL
jgi:hypothetical protein